MKQEMELAQRREEANLLHDVLLGELKKPTSAKNDGETELSYFQRRFYILVINVQTQASRKRGMIFGQDYVVGFVSSYLRGFLGRDLCCRMNIPGDEQYGR